MDCLLPRKQECDGFFDSFGRSITAFDENIQNFCKEVNLCYQNLPLQSPCSTTCGQFVCFFIWKRTSGKSFKQVLDLFSSNQQDNDKMVTAKVNQIFDVSTKVYDKALIQQGVIELIKQ